MELKDNLKAMRKAAKLSQKTLAEFAGVSQQLIGALETGRQSSTSRLPEIAAALGKTVGELDPRYDADHPESGVVMVPLNVPMSTTTRLRDAFETKKHELRFVSVLARQAGQKPVTVRSYFIDGPEGRRPPLDVCEALGKVLGVRGKWLFYGKGPRLLSDPEPVTSKLEPPNVSMVPLIDAVAAGRLASPASHS